MNVILIEDTVFADVVNKSLGGGHRYKKEKLYIIYIIIYVIYNHIIARDDCHPYKREKFGQRDKHRHKMKNTQEHHVKMKA